MGQDMQAGQARAKAKETNSFFDGRGAPAGPTRVAGFDGKRKNPEKAGGGINRAKQKSGLQG